MGSTSMRTLTRLATDAGACLQSSCSLARAARPSVNVNKSVNSIRRLGTLAPRSVTAAAATATATRRQPVASLTTSSTATASSASSFRSKTTPSRSLPPSSLEALNRAYATATSSDAASHTGKTSVTTLSNGVRVATEDTPGHFSALGVYVDAGSRFERPWVVGESGVSHLLDRLAFKSTTTRTEDEMRAQIDAMGGNVMCSSSRETIMYQSSMFDQDAESVLDVLADTILNPIISSEELAAQRSAVMWEVSEIESKPEMILPELLHNVAYRNNTLGNALLCPAESLQVMTADNIRDFMRLWYTPDRVVIAGAGMPHAELVRMAEERFGGMTSQFELDPSTPSVTSSGSSSVTASPGSSTFSTPLSSPSSATSYSSSADFSTSAAASAKVASAMRTAMSTAKAEYTGGELFIDAKGQEFTHVHVGFEGVSIHDPDIYALATIQILLGGGGSFSAGGPGKGMYSRLFTNVLNQYHRVDFCAAFHHCYADSGLIGIAAAVEPSFAREIGPIIARELELLMTERGHGAVHAAEVARARNQLKSSLIMALESRLVQVEDLGRQVLAHGTKISVDEMCRKIDEVDVATVRRVARRVLRSQHEPKETPLNYGLGSGQAVVVAQGNTAPLKDLRSLLFSRGIGARPTLG